MGCVVVTGAAGGIGQALVQAFAEAGHAVLGTDVVACPPSLYCDSYLICDLARTVADPIYAAEAFASLRDALADRPLDALINNAAMQILRPFEDLGREDWRNTLDVNLLAPFLWAQGLLPELDAAHGCVLNISSIHARLTKPGFVAYATSKAALSGMTRAMAVELGTRVRVNAIEPAAIDTTMLRAGFIDNAEGLARLEAHHPSGCIGSPSSLAQLALAVVAASGQFLNGAVLGLDGGISNRLHDPA